MNSIRRYKWLIPVLGGLIALLPAKGSPADTKEQSGIDPASGMIIDENWKTVRVMCSSCHSPKLFTSYGGNRETWAGLIKWMQKKQGLWELPPEIEDQILTYLSKNYPPGEMSRRRNLPAHLRPANPYVSEARAEYEKRLRKGEITKPDLGELKNGKK